MKYPMESTYGGWHRFTGEVREEMVPAPGGVKLFTRVFLPDAKFRGPAVIYRSPYVTKDPLSGPVSGEPADLVAAGFAVVHQHCRGCGLSEGECFPYLYERGDSLALHEWIRLQSFYAGELYLLGSSYTSSVHLACLNAVGPDVKGAFLAVQDCDRRRIIYRNGFYKCGLHGGWVLGMYRKNQLEKKNTGPDVFRTMPLTNLDRAAFGEEAPFIIEELRHPDPADPFWQTEAGGADYASALEGLKIPVLFVTAFYDIYTEGVLAMWNSLAPAARKRCALVVTPFAHGYYGPENPEIPFPNGKLETAWPHCAVDWFGALRDNRAPRFVTLGQTTWYAQYESVWRTAPFLTEGKSEVTFYLQGDRTLVPSPAPEEELSYIYNPYDPAEFEGGCCNNFGGQQKQDPPNSRNDILSFVSAPLEKPLRLQGSGEVRLKVRSDCPDTCFYARLSLVNKAGETWCLRDDIVSLRAQNPRYVPGKTAEVRLHFAPNAVYLAPGERLRLDVSSSCWPHFIPHRNKLGPYWEQESAAIARNTVFAGVSALTLREDKKTRS